MCFILNGWPGGQRKDRAHGLACPWERGEGWARAVSRVETGAVPTREEIWHRGQGDGRSHFMVTEQPGGDGGRSISRLWRDCRRALSRAVNLVPTARRQ